MAMKSRRKISKEENSKQFVRKATAVTVYSKGGKPLIKTNGGQSR